MTRGQRGGRAGAGALRWRRRWEAWWAMARRRLSWPPAPRALGERALIGLLFFCPLALGTLEAWAVAGMLGGAALALAATALAADRRPLLRPTLAGLVGFAGLGVAGAIGVQCLPLPGAWVAVLAPETAKTYAFALAPLGPAADQLWHPLSLDGPATGRELAKALAYVAAYIAALAVAESRRGRHRLAAWLAAGGVTVAAIGYGHLLLGANLLFGQSLYRVATPRFVTTFGDSNNAAGLFVLCAPVALGLALRARVGAARALWGLAYAALGAAVFLSFSRGGGAAFLGGQLAFVALLARQTPAGAPGLRPPRRWLGAALAAAGALALAGWLAGEPFLARLAELAPPAAGGAPVADGWSKWTGFVQTLPLIGDFAPWGVGRGAFAGVAGHYLTFSAQTAEYVENEPLQLCADLGLPLGLAVLGLLLWAVLRPAGGRNLGPLECGLGAGLLSLGLQSAADFSLELGGVALPAAVALALWLQAAPQPTAGDRKSPGANQRGREAQKQLPQKQLPKGPRLGARSCLAGLTVLTPLAVWGIAASVPDWREETDGFATQPLGRADLAEAARLLARHPAGFVVPYRLAREFLAEGWGGRGAERRGALAAALPWLNRAMYWKPPFAEPHRLAAGALAALGHRSQALLEARLYFERSGGDPSAVAELARWPALADVRWLRQAVPDDAAGLMALAELLQQLRRADEALALAEEAVGRAPAEAALLERQAALLIAAGRPGQAAAAAQRAVALAPQAASGYAALAKARDALGNRDDARRALEDGLGLLPGDEVLLLALVQLELSADRPDRAAAALKRLGPQASAAARGQVFAVQAEIYRREGRSAKAEEALRNAARVQPAAGYELPLAALLEGESRYSAAADTLTQLKAITGASDLDQRILSDRQQAAALDVKTQEDLRALPPP